jgi:fatty acid-binding protein DegV
VIEPIGRVRGRQKAVAEFRKLFEAETADRDGLRLAIAHANAPEWVETLTEMAQSVRPKARVELVETLGAVVGTHAGPGAVGFFWFPD